MTAPALGTILLPRGGAQRAAIARMDPAEAMVKAVAAYLRCAEFVTWGGEAADTAFQLNEVIEHWPEPDRKMSYPSASVISTEATDLDAHNLTPTPLEETLDTFGAGTVLWKLHEAVEVLQVDFWTQSKPARKAIAAALPGLFAPGEDGARVLLAGSQIGFHRPVRATLLDFRRMDTPQAVYESERRLMARIQCEVDAVELRCASVLTPQAVLAEVGEATDTTPPDPEDLILDLVNGG